MMLGLAFSCDHGQETGEPCPARAVQAFEEPSFGGGIAWAAYDDTSGWVDGSFREMPEGWRLTREGEPGEVRCPQHA